LMLCVHRAMLEVLQSIHSCLYLKNLYRCVKSDGNMEMFNSISDVP